MTTRRKIFDIIQIGDKSNLISRSFDIFLVIVILLNISAMFMLTFDELAAYSGILHVIEIVTTLIFLAEYILRIWTADLLYPEYSRGKAVFRFIISFDGIIDLLTIIPVFFLTGFIAFRMLRVVRIFHLFRINAQYDSFNVITSVIYEKRNQIISSIFIILILMLSSSLCMYSAEHAAQPEVFKNAFSGMWWAVSTILTVGYGDIYPITFLGRVMAIIIAFLGVGVVAIPTGIISAGFVEQYTKDQSLTDYRSLDLEEIVEIRVDQRLIRKSVTEIKKEDGLDVYLIIREDMRLLPVDDMRLKRGDIIVARYIR